MGQNSKIKTIKNNVGNHSLLPIKWYQDESSKIKGVYSVESIKKKMENRKKVKISPNLKKAKHRSLHTLKGRGKIKANTSRNARNIGK